MSRQRLLRPLKTGGIVTCRRRLAKEEERAAGHFRVVEHAVDDFQFGDPFAVEVIQSRLFFLEVGREGVVAGHPAVASAEQADEE